MRAFTVHKFQVCRLTGCTLIEASYAHSDNDLAVIKNEFTNPETAMCYIRLHAKTWFTTQLQKFVTHKEHIIQNESSDQHKALKSCKDLVKAFMDLHVFEIVTRFGKNMEKFESILPHPENKSYQSSLENFNQLKQFANHFTNLKLN